MQILSQKQAVFNTENNIYYFKHYWGKHFVFEIGRSIIIIHIGRCNREIIIKLFAQKNPVCTPLSRENHRLIRSAVPHGHKENRKKTVTENKIIFSRPVLSDYFSWELITLKSLSSLNWHLPKYQSSINNTHFTPQQFWKTSIWNCFYTLNLVMDQRFKLPLCNSIIHQNLIRQFYSNYESKR